MKLKATKDKIIAAAVILFILVTAWFCRGNYLEKAAAPEQTPALSVSCATILDNMDCFNKDKLEVLPADGVIYPPQTVVFYEGESVFNVLQRDWLEGSGG